MEFRTLRPGEREALLDLLDGWDVGDGWRGRDFFRRYLELDPTYADENVHVAAAGGRIAGCVQVFPRRLRVGEAAVPTGGIGSVYTHPDHRRQGVAEALLARAVAAMRARGMELSLLFASLVPWYEGLGWRSWRRRRLWLARGAPRPAAPDAGLELGPFVADRDLEALRHLHERFDAGRPGTALRDAVDWEASLRVAGNPCEDFLVARDGSRPLANPRAVVLYGVLTLTEYAHEPGAEPALARLLARLLEPRVDDPLARRAGVCGDARAGLLAGPAEADPGLRAALAARGLELGAVEDGSAMLRCLDAPALARRLGEAPDTAAEALLVRRLPPERFAFWPADRF